MKQNLTSAQVAEVGNARKNGLMKLISVFLIAILTTPCLFATTLFESTRTDFRDESIYFVMTTRFYDGDPSNNTQCWDNQAANQNDPPWRGDFKGLIEKLDYIKALGFTAVWVTPVVANASGYDYHGYHAMDFSMVDPRYLSEDVTFQTLIDEAHARDMKIILDVVLQHTGNFGEKNLCKLFDRDYNADQSVTEECMIPYTKSQGGKLPDNYSSLIPQNQYETRVALIANINTSDYNDTNNYYHHYGFTSSNTWDEPGRWFAHIHSDCLDLNTENPAVYNYIIDCYSKFIEMGVDGFRIDTSGHISRLTFNKAFIPGFQAAANSEKAKAKRGNTDFFMYGEVCALDANVYYRGQACLSAFYYTWAENKTYSWDTNSSSWNGVNSQQACNEHVNLQSVWQTGTDDGGQSSRTSNNAFLSGNAYHTPDYSQASGMSVIDFPVHHSFNDIGQAWGVASPDNDKLYNDATWNVVYVDSHDYGPGPNQQTRYSGGTDNWASNMSLMFTYRGIPCIYYGSETEFRAGAKIDEGPNGPLSNYGRAYYGGYIKGDANVTDFAEYSNATGNMAATLSAPLAKHLQQLNKLRQSIPALRKGQYSRDNCEGQYAFKRRYTDGNTDSFALVTIQGSAKFTGLPGGTYIEAVTGQSQTISDDGTLTADCPSNAGNLRIWVLQTNKNSISGKVVEDGPFIYGSASTGKTTPTWDGTEEEGTDYNGGGSSSGGGSSTLEPYSPTVTDSEFAVFFEASPTGDFANSVRVYVWDANNSNYEFGYSWNNATAAKKMGTADNGNIIWKWTYPGTEMSDSNLPTNIIFRGANSQTGDLVFHKSGYYTEAGYDSSVNVPIDNNPSAVDENIETNAIIYSAEGNICILNAESASVNIYGLDSRIVYSGNGDCIVPVKNAGVYIVKVGNTTKKIIVR